MKGIKLFRIKHFVLMGSLGLLLCLLLTITSRASITAQSSLPPAITKAKETAELRFGGSFVSTLDGNAILASLDVAQPFNLPNLGGPPEGNRFSEPLDWTIELVEDGKLFSFMSDHSIATDFVGNPHFAYGQDHLYYAYFDGSAWQSEVVDNDNDVGKYASIALDSLDRPHISYYDSKNQNLKYAHWVGNSWIITIIDTEGDVGIGGTIALDQADNPHISYYDNTNNQLKYAFWTGQNWDYQTVSSGGSRSSLAIDTVGIPHIAYGSGNIFYARPVNGVWEVENIQDPVFPDADYDSPSLALDSENHPHIVYDFSIPNTTIDNLRYVYWTGTSWQRQVIDSNSSSSGISLDVDDNDNWHVSYYNGVNGSLRYASNANGGISQTIDSFIRLQGNILPVSTSLVTDNDNTPHLVYHDIYRHQLKYIRLLSDGSPIEVIDQANNLGQYTSLVIGNESLLLVGYYDGFANDLKFASSENGVWDIQTLQGETAGGSSLAIDSNGYPHISYYGGSSQARELHVSHWNGSTWIDEVIDENIGFLVTSGFYQTALAIDRSGHYHIAYAGDNRLRYAHNINGDWQIYESEVFLLNEAHLDLAIDTFNNPHISFSGSLRLKYATFIDGIWNIQIIDESSFTGEYNSIVLAPNNLAQISYLDKGNSGRYDLKYARNEGNSWEIEIVDSNQRVGEFTSISLDIFGQPCISYYDLTNTALKYACRNGLSWTIQAIDETGTVGLYTSLGFNENTIPYIGYQDAGNGDLKVAIGQPRYQVIYKLFLPVSHHSGE